MEPDIQEQREIDERKRRFRRNAALISFLFLIIICIFYMGAGIIISPEQAKALAEFNGVIIALCAVFASIILGHLGFEHLSKF
ncbi:MAG: hypothetical protein R3230_00805 [Nitrosopumilaceae archaeon]|nr:hypothetical protein [Nitrosopumilaceae archaeon]